MKKTRILLTTDEWKIIIDSLNAHRNKLIAEGKHTDFADEVLLKAMNAPTRKIKIA